MGKIRHTKKVKSVPVEDNEPMEDTIDDDEEDVAEHNQPDFDKRSVISNKTIKSLVSKKKDKIKLKRQFLLKRLDAAHQAKREAKEQAARRQTVIVSDMKHTFEHSLGQIESYLEEQRLTLAQQTKKTTKQVASQGERNRRFQANIETFNKISQSAEYRANPFDLIKKQLERQLSRTTS